MVICMDRVLLMENADFKIENVFWTYLCAALSLSAVLTEKYILSKLTLKSKKLESLSYKLILYKKATILRFVLLEIPIITSLAAFGLTRNVFFLALSITIMIYLLAIYPNNEKMISKCNPNIQQMVFFQNPDLPLTD